jgi:oligoribonuclease NrnB/cAMP/cGMP phosphodiesterase (DHH superfamily)
MKIFHLSHIDLDGYSCQLISSYFDKNIEYFNSNYGNEINARLKEVESCITALDCEEEILLLITDLNLSKDECAFINQAVARMRFLNYKITLQLLDHHATGENMANEYDWYHLDISKSATLLTYEYFMKKFKNNDFPKMMQKYVQAVNAFDLWKKDDDMFEFGKVLNRYIAETKEINKMLFKDYNARYRISILKKTFEFLSENSYIALDDKIVAIKKEILGNGKIDTIDNLISAFVTDLLTKDKDRLTIYFNNYKGILTVQIGNTSVLGNSFLEANPEFDFFMDVNPNGNVGLRANNKLDVSKMAGELFNGGGHKNASGGRMGNLREFYAYEELKKHVQKYIDSKSK